MTNDEFDNYLALLAKLLRLGHEQRDAIAGELRAHLEDRLEDLLARGVPKHEAVKQALEEFGDAAALASEFVSISRGRRRRWIMRLTTASAAAIVLIAAGIFTFWPGTNAGPGAAAVIAQNPGGGQPGGAPPDIDRAALVTTLEDKLNQRIDAEWVETPFKDVVDHLHKMTEITFYVKAKKIDEVDVALDTPVTQNFKQIRLSTLLDLMLEELGLVYAQKDDLVIITTPEDASATMEVRVYDCRDLLAMPTGLPGRPGAVPGGPQGAVPAGADPFGGPPGFRAPGFGAPAGGAGDPFTPPTTTPILPGSTRPPRLEEPPAAPPRIPSRNPGDEVLPQLGGAMPMAPGGGPSGMAGGGMMGGPGLGGGGFGGDGGPQWHMSVEDLKAEQLMGIVTTAVEPDSWSLMGGPGTIGQYNGLLVVSQSARTHTKVEKVLDMLRDAAGLPRTKQSRVVK